MRLDCLQKGAKDWGERKGFNSLEVSMRLKNNVNEGETWESWGLGLDVSDCLVQQSLRFQSLTFQQVQVWGNNVQMEWQYIKGFLGGDAGDVVHLEV